MQELLPTLESNIPNSLIFFYMINHGKLDNPTVPYEILTLFVRLLLLFPRASRFSVSFRLAGYKSFL